MMLKVMLGREVRGGVFEYHFDLPDGGGTVQGRSRQPLLDACRKFKSLGGDTGAQAHLFRPGGSEPDLIANVGRAADLRVKETPIGPKFEKWEKFEGIGEADR